MKRRGQGEGSIYQRGDGVWVANVNLGWHNGRRVRRVYYAKTRKAAHERLTRALRELRDGVQPAPRRETVAAYLAEWLESLAGTVRPTTLRRYRQIVEHQLVPNLGRIRLSDLSPADVESMLRQLSDDLSPRTVHHARAVLRTALARAMRHGLIARNAAALASAPRLRQREVQALSPDEVRRFLAGIHGHRHEALFLTAVATGMRQGELLGLRWTDVDATTGTLTVRHTL